MKIPRMSLPVETGPRYHNNEPYCGDCGRSNAMNPVSLGRTQVEWMFRLHHEWGGSADHRMMQLQGSIYATCSWPRYWGLTDRYDGVGTFRITDKGYLFMADELAIPKTAWMFDQRIVEFEGPMVRASDILQEGYATYEEIVSDLRARRRTAPTEVLRANRQRRC